MLNATDFYNEAAEFYDEMTRFGKRLKRESEWIKQWRRNYPFDSALDAGCGTGSTALALAAAGIRTTGIDISEKMIVKAGGNARNMGLNNVEFLVSSFEEAAYKIDKRFNAVFCLGNSLVHIMPDTMLNKTMRSFEKLLNPGGVFVIQLLNYEKILSDRERVIDIYREGPDEFIRFYDFDYDILKFNILHIDWSSESAKHRIQTTQHYPYKREELEQSLAKHDMLIDRVYGNIKMAEFNPKSSPNLVIAAQKN